MVTENAFGCTEEDQRRKNYGLAQIGRTDEPAFDRATGSGYVAARHGDYTDALTKKHGVLLLLAENTGAVAPTFVKLLRILAKTVTTSTGADTTIYGTSRASHHAFFPHHLAAISAAIVGADADTLLNAAATRAFMWSAGMSAPPCARPDVAHPHAA